MARNLGKTALQIVIFWIVFLFVLPSALLRAEDALGIASWRFAFAGQAAVGITLFVLCGSLGLASSAMMVIDGRGTPIPFDCPRELVVRGPYRVIRNPMVVAGIGQGVAVGVCLGSWIVIAYAIAGAILWNLAVRPWEERDLRERFGGRYEAYRRAIRCWIPSRPYREDGSAPERGLARSTDSG